MEVRGVPYCGPGKHGDFKWMLQQSAYARWLLVFNDNVVDAGEAVPHDGASSAAVRTKAFKYNEASPPRVIGVPTGWCPSAGGFKVVDGHLEPFASRAITLAVERRRLWSLSIVESSTALPLMLRNRAHGARTVPRMRG